MKNKAIAIILNILFLPMGYYYIKESRRFFIFLVVIPFLSPFMYLCLMLMPSFMYGIPFLIFLGIIAIGWWTFISVDTFKSCVRARISNLFLFRMPHSIWVIVFYVLYSFIIGVVTDVIKPYFADAKVVMSGSMKPTLYTGDYIYVRSIHDASTINRGDLIAYKLPGSGRKKHYIHRVIGVPGDYIELSSESSAHNGIRYYLLTIRLNGKPLPHSNSAVINPSTDNSRPFIHQIYLEETNGEKTYKIIETNDDTFIKNNKVRLGDDEFFILGDNRDNARDSRYTGLIKAKDIDHLYMFTYFSVDFQNEKCEKMVNQGQKLPEFCSDLDPNTGQFTGFITRWRRAKIRWDRIGTISK